VQADLRWFDAERIRPVSDYKQDFIMWIKKDDAIAIAFIDSMTCGRGFGSPFDNVG